MSENFIEDDVGTLKIVRKVFDVFDSSKKMIANDDSVINNTIRVFSLNRFDYV